MPFEVSSPSCTSPRPQGRFEPNSLHFSCCSQLPMHAPMSGIDVDRVVQLRTEAETDSEMEHERDMTSESRLSSGCTALALDVSPVGKRAVMWGWLLTYRILFQLKVFQIPNPRPLSRRIRMSKTSTWSEIGYETALRCIVARDRSFVRSCTCASACASTSASAYV